MDQLTLENTVSQFIINFNNTYNEKIKTIEYLLLVLLYKLAIFETVEISYDNNKFVIKNPISQFVQDYRDELTRKIITLEGPLTVDISISKDLIVDILDSSIYNLKYLEIKENVDFITFLNTEKEISELDSLRKFTSKLMYSIIQKLCIDGDSYFKEHDRREDFNEKPFMDRRTYILFYPKHERDFEAIYTEVLYDEFEDKKILNEYKNQLFGLNFCKNPEPKMFRFKKSKNKYMFQTISKYVDENDPLLGVYTIIHQKYYSKITSENGTTWEFLNKEHIKKIYQYDRYYGEFNPDTKTLIYTGYFIF